MPTQFFITKWKATGLRCPDHEISFVDSNGSPRSVTLIQMPNGTGKTTTLHLLRAALSGEAQSWGADRVRSMQKKEGDANGSFLIECLCDGQRLTLVMKFDFEEGSVSYSTTSPGTGNKPGFTPPSSVRRFLKPDFVRLFVFNGEEAEELLDPEHTNANDAIDSLFQLKLFDRMSSWIEEHWQDHYSKAKAGEDKGLARRKNRVDSLRKRLAACRKAHSEASDGLKKAQDLFEAKSKQFREELKRHTEYSEKLRVADRELEEAKARVSDCLASVQTKMRDPHALSAHTSMQLFDLRSNLDRVKLPESAAREFFEELADEEMCVCGRALDDATRSHIRETAIRYLGSDDVSLLNAMKGDIANFIGQDPGLHAEELDGLLQGLRDANRREQEARTAKDAVESDAVADNPELVGIDEEVNALRNAVEKWKDEVEKYEDTSTNDDDSFAILILERRLKDAEHQLAEITETVDLRRKKEILTKVLRAAHAASRTAIASVAVDNANARIRELMPSNAIRIEAIRNCLALEGQEGGSQGETLAVAYAFLATFFNSASHVFPFIVDSPAGPIDLGIRPKIADLLPALTRQLIAFTISSERQYFSDYLLESAGNNWAVTTLFRSGDNNFDESARRVDGCQETVDGLLVPGKEFFDGFQLEMQA